MANQKRMAKQAILLGRREPCIYDFIYFLSAAAPITNSGCTCNLGGVSAEFIAQVRFGGASAERKEKSP